MATVTGQNFNRTVNQFLAPLKGDFASDVLKLGLIMYAGKAAPKLPFQIEMLFQNTAFRIGVLSLLLWSGNNNPTRSVIAAGSFVIAMDMLGGKSLIEGFIIEQNTDVLPQCLGVTMQDLLNVFNGDMVELRKALRMSNVPFNIELNDDRAPLLATFLINYGYPVTEMCRLPPQQNVGFMDSLDFRNMV